MSKITKIERVENLTPPLVAAIYYWHLGEKYGRRLCCTPEMADLIMDAWIRHRACPHFTNDEIGMWQEHGKVIPILRSIRERTGYDLRGAKRFFDKNRHLLPVVLGRSHLQEETLGTGDY